MDIYNIKDLRENLNNITEMTIKECRFFIGKSYYMTIYYYANNKYYCNHSNIYSPLIRAFYPDFMEGDYFNKDKLQEFLFYIYNKIDYLEKIIDYPVFSGEYLVISKDKIKQEDYILYIKNHLPKIEIIIAYKGNCLFDLKGNNRLDDKFYYELPLCRYFNRTLSYKEIIDIIKLFEKYGNIHNLMRVYGIKKIYKKHDISKNLLRFNSIFLHKRKLPKGLVLDSLDRIRYKKECRLCPTCGKYHEGIRGECDLYKILPYHSGINKINYTSEGKKSEVKLGFEIEKDIRLNKKDIFTLKKGGWRAELDGSVNGGEYITPVIGINEIPKFFKKYKCIFDYKIDNKCGGHIHLSSSKYNDIIKLYQEIAVYRPLLWAIFPTRALNNYCNKDNVLGNKYRDVHLPDRLNTIEFRIFPGVECYEDVIFRGELLKFIYNNRILDNDNPDDFTKAKDIIKNNIKEITEIILIRYNKNTIPGILERIMKYYSIYGDDETMDFI